MKLRQQSLDFLSNERDSLITKKIEKSWDETKKWKSIGKNIKSQRCFTPICPGMDGSAEGLLTIWEGWEI